MIIKVTRDFKYDFHPYNIYINDIKHNFEDSLNYELTEESVEIYAKTYWFKTPVYNIDNNNKSCLVKISLFINPKIWFSLIFLTAIIIIISLIIDNNLLLNLAVCLCALLLFIQFFMYSFGYKKYIKLILEYDN